jgi:hypothetical protein
VDLGFTQQAVFVFTVNVTGVFCYFDGFPDDSWPVGPDVDYNRCSVEVDGMCGLWSVRLRLILSRPVWCL